jgi:hypothetical protein
MNKKKKFKKNIFANFFLFFFFFFTTDFITTIIYESFTKKIIHQSKVDYEDFGIEHNKFHHHLKENISTSGIFNDQKYKVKTNSLGFRDKEVRNINYKNVGKRLVLIGDSFTFGTLLNYEDTFAGMIDDELSQLVVGGEGVEWEVLNLGVPSYSPVIYYNKVKFF